MRIGELKGEVLREMGINIPLERLRRYQYMGLFRSTRKRNGYRDYKEEQLDDIYRTLMLVEIGVRPADILKGNDIVIQKRVWDVSKIVDKLIKVNFIAEGVKDERD